MRVFGNSHESKREIAKDTTRHYNPCISTDTSHSTSFSSKIALLLLLKNSKNRAFSIAKSLFMQSLRGSGKAITMQLFINSRDLDCNDCLW